MFVRWSNLSAEVGERARLPGYREEAVVRHFDAPEAISTRFYEVQAKSILNRVPEASRMPFRWTINPYRGCTHACNFCFARPTHTYLDFNAGRDFEREIVVKVNAPEVLRIELAKRSWKGEHVALGTNTDPYQWVEGRYKLMPEIWGAMLDAGNPCSVLTKSPLLLRDLPLMRELAARTDFSAALSVPTLDEKAWRETERHMSGISIASIVQLLLGSAELRQYSARMLEQLRSRLGQGHTPAVAFQQILTAFEFQLANLAAQGGLNHRQEGGGAGKTAEFRDMPKILELF